MENHKFKFKGIWLPAYVMEQFAARLISPSEMMLLAFIDGLSDKDHPCFASNRYLSEMIGMSQMGVSNAIAKLKRMGLVHVVSSGGGRSRRELFSAWTHPSGNGGGPIGQWRVPLTTLKEDNIITDGQSRRTMGASNMPFEFPGYETDNPKATKFDTRMAEQLCQAIKERTKLKRRYSISKWANSIRLLRQETSKARIRQAMKWYCGHVGDEYVPQAFSAAGFRDKFIQIEAAMKREQGPAVEDIPIGQHALAISQRLRGKNWPKGAAVHLPAVVQRSLDYVATMRKRLCSTTLKPASKVEQRAVRVQVWLRDGAFPNSLSLVEGHYTDLWKRVVDWDGWNGRLKPINETELCNILRTLVGAYCGDPGRLDTLLEMTNED